MTLYMSIAVRFFSNKTQRTKLWWLWPSLGTIGHTGFFLILFHWINHTPNILKTVSLPLLIATAYCVFLTYQYREID